MSHLIQLKQKIKSIQMTRKITHAVRLVSMSLYTQLEKENTALTYYKDHTLQLFTKLALSAPEWKNPILSPQDILDSNPLIILISTSKGLCGSLNSNLFRYFEYSFFKEKHQNIRFITIGQKATKYIKEKYPQNVFCHYNELTLNDYISITNDLINKILNSEKPLSSVVFFSNILKTFFVQKPYKTTLIPFRPDPLDNNNNNPQKLPLIWEQKPKKILNHIAHHYIKVSIMTLLFQALHAEQAARFIAMDNSTTNADKFLEKLILQFNKQRQALITSEVSELSATLPR